MDGRDSPAVTPDLSRSQFVRNLASNLTGFGLGILSNLVLTPYWIGHLGVAAYGLIPLTNALVSYLGVITTVLSSSVGRFITIEVSRGDLARANRTFNTSLWGSIAIGVVVLAVGSAASFHADSLIAVPDALRGDSRLMLRLATLTFVVSLLQTPFAAATYCVNRLDLNNWAGVAMRVLQIAVGVGLVATLYPKPGAVMIASLAGAVVGAAAAIFYWRRFMPWSRVAWLVEPEILRAQLAFGGWSVINLVGALLYLQMDLLVVNRMLGPVAGGQYAALAQWSLLIRGLGGTVGAILGPTITHYYARHEIGVLVKYARRSVLALGLFLALPIGIIGGLAGPLLTRWLGPAYSQYAGLLLLMVLPLCVNVAVTPLFVVQSAANRVRTPAVVTCLMGAGNLALGIGLTYSLGMYGVAIAGAVMLTAKNAIFTPLYSALILGCRRTVFFREIVRTALLSCVMTGVAFAAGRYVSLDTWGRVAAATMVLAALYVPIAWYGALASGERRQIKEAILVPAMARLAGRLQ